MRLECASIVEHVVAQAVHLRVWPDGMDLRLVAGHIMRVICIA